MDLIEMYKKKIANTEAKLKATDSPIEKRQYRAAIGKLYRELEKAKSEKN